MSGCWSERAADFWLMRLMCLARSGMRRARTENSRIAKSIGIVYACARAVRGPQVPCEHSSLLPRALHVLQATGQAFTRPSCRARRLEIEVDSVLSAEEVREGGEIQIEDRTGGFLRARCGSWRATYARRANPIDDDPLPQRSQY